MSEILVIGHKNPDTDAICSAIGYAEFKRRTGMPEALAARCGDTNDRIDFVLKNFGRHGAARFERAAGLHGGRGVALDGRKKSPPAARAGRSPKMPRPAFPF